MAQNFQTYFIMKNLFRCNIYTRIQAAFMSILLTAVVLFFAVSPSEAANRCESLFRQKSKNQLSTQDLIDDSHLVKVAISLRKRASQIDPVKSHVTELVLPIQQVANQIKIALLEKTHEKLYVTRKPMLEYVIREIETRVAENRVTYEFAALLSFRVGWLLKMSDTNPVPHYKDPRFNKPMPYIETSHYYMAKTYQTHENFMAALEKANHFVPLNDSQGYSFRAPQFKAIFVALKGFPSQMLLPSFHDLGIPALNYLMALKTFPLGNIRKATGANKFDGIFFDEFNFPMHDFSHAFGIKEDPRQGTLSEKIVGLLETQSLSNVNRQKEKQLELWNIFHFLLFHEGIRYDYTDLTLDGLKEHYRMKLESKLKNIFFKSAEGEIFSKWLLTLPKDHQEKTLQAEADRYLNMLNAQIDANQVPIKSELDMIKILSGQNQ